MMKIEILTGNWTSHLTDFNLKQRSRFEIAYAQRTTGKLWWKKVDTVWVIMEQSTYKTECRYTCETTTWYGWKQIEHFENKEDALSFKKELEDVLCLL